ncbi:uncharacterized protein LOC111711396 isoform X1 [Eurytemora carolleeae]|uniref:uncharacterized protein LOC111711396 isoform X1 n=1 Tax=Eurytemora carolleeae TaxID=1294199 RepID=UPI000C7938F0|nr:uncharacterized protein LOC111711396 isoform X1 [Eurytemora carolleeae]|eukprot:XP_023341512.1 uncharacterized protein LOC111711396 isoform X1 [Eurytemora affinis]
MIRQRKVHHGSQEIFMGDVEREKEGPMIGSKPSGLCTNFCILLFILAVLGMSGSAYQYYELLNLKNQLSENQGVTANLEIELTAERKNVEDCKNEIEEMETLIKKSLGEDFIKKRDVSGENENLNDTPATPVPRAPTPPGQVQNQQEAENKDSAASDLERAAETQKAADAQQAAEVQKAMEAQRAAEAQKAAEARKAAEAQQAAEAQKAAEAKQAAEAQKAAEAQRAADAQKAAEAQRAAEAQKAAEAQRAAEAQKTAEAQKAAEAQKIAQEQAAKQQQPPAQQPPAS